MTTTIIAIDQLNLYSAFISGTYKKIECLDCLRRSTTICESAYIQTCLSSVAEKLRRRLCIEKIAGSNPASGHLATFFRNEI